MLEERSNDQPFDTEQRGNNGINANDQAEPQVKRINGHYILSEIGSVLNFQKGILFTIRELLLRPGSSVREFIHEDRRKLVKPIGFIILCSLVYILLQRALEFQDAYMNYSDQEWGVSSVSAILEWVTDNYGFANIIMATFVALWAKLFFRRYDYNFFEILVLLYFLMGMQMLILSLFGMLEHLLHISILDKGSLLAILYVCWGMGRFFDRHKKWNYPKAFATYMIGLSTFIVAAILSGVLVDLIIR